MDDGHGADQGLGKHVVTKPAWHRLDPMLGNGLVMIREVNQPKPEFIQGCKRDELETEGVEQPDDRKDKQVPGP